MSWPRVLTAVLRGFHQAPHDLPTVQTTATLIVHCAATFLQSASRILRSLTLYSILKVSYHLWCQVKPAPRTRTLNTFHCGSNLQILSKNKFVYVTDMRSLTKLIPNTLSLPPPRHSPPLLLWWGPLGDQVLQSLLHVLSSQLPCLHFVILDGCVNLELSTAGAVQRQTSCKA